MTPCLQPGCSNLTLGGYCTKHKKQENKRKRGHRCNLYDTALWKKLRKQHLLKQPLCKECKKKNIIKTAIVVDHIQPHRGSRALFFDTDNYQSLCISCHNKKSRKEENERSKYI